MTTLSTDLSPAVLPQTLDHEVAPGAGVLGGLRNNNALGTTLGAVGLARDPSLSLGGLGWTGLGRGTSGYTGKNVGGYTSVILGAQDKSLTDAVIKRNYRSIVSSYDKEAQKLPDLRGQVMVKVIIKPDGTVESAEVKSNTLASAVNSKKGTDAADIVGKGMCARLMHIQFPQPKGGGKMIVTYPFVFAAVK